MWTVFGFVVFLVCVDVSIQERKNNKTEGYFWRDYDGFIPHDAFPGGNEKSGVTYIGQVLYNNLLVPAKIVQSEEKAYFEWGLQEHTTTENIKILCTDKPDMLKWLSSSDYNNNRLRDYINGGYEPKSELFIGRMSKNGEVLLGKLLVNNRVVLHATQNGRSVDSEIFEVLYYDDPSKSAPVVRKIGHHWRDYVGVIPKDALPAGKEGNKITYIAQVLYQNLLVPGKIIESENKAHFEWGMRAHTSSNEVKIFCTDRPEAYHWHSTNQHDFRNVKDKEFVVASYEGGGVLYIGRVNIKGDKIVGKLLVNEDVVLHAVHNGKAAQFLEFEVLYYDPPSNQTSSK